MQGVRGSNPLSSTYKMNTSYLKYLKKIILEIKELFTSQILIAVLSLLQVSYVVKQLGPENYGKITIFVTFISLFFRGINSKNSDVALLALKNEDKNIFYSALLFDLIMGLVAFIFCLTIYFTPYISKIDLNSFSKYFFFYLSCRVIFNISETSKAVLINSGNLKLFSYIESIGILIRFTLIVSLIYLNPTVESYILGNSFYMLIFGLICYFVSSKQNNKIEQGLKVSFIEYWESIKSTYKKIRYDQIIGLIPQHFDILLLSIISDINIVGIYKFAKRLVEPINYIIAAFIPWIQSQYSSDNLMNFNDFVKKLLLPMSFAIMSIFIFLGRKIITTIGSNEFSTAYNPLIILAVGYSVYLLTFWIRQLLLFNNLIIYHVYSKIIYSVVFISLSIPLTIFYSANGLSLSLSLAILSQKVYEFFIYKNKIIPNSLK